ncbi:exodeoxyribonuclease V subunit alpha [Inhella gelatinilytica]|uniref:RecBCD enzyme subunit RecD n=1 Tax=Inhella gelatinilytica TaxID=2795030 RepID=A0A931J195_9BURK|nr:exodeoxyribonuclease V subunit alpha [Inhella gelatinilytica]MBH9554293.1 exodeoxyribonuclease V subunit alpha [Inhella gelatinilytica]
MTPPPLQEWPLGPLLRPLDRALATWLRERDPHTPDSLLAAAALCAHLEGQGHSCLPLPALHAAPSATLAWPADPALDEQLRDRLPADGAQARDRWRSSPWVSLGDQGSPAAPLVLEGDRLYLRRYWQTECRLAAHLLSRAQADVGEHTLDRPLARQTLAALFPAAPGTDIDWQRVACALALRRRLTVITGGPGTGKTYTAARLLVALHALHTQHPGPTPLRVGLSAPTGKAAARLRESIDQALARLPGGPPVWASALPAARTLHSLLGARPGTRAFRHTAHNPLMLDVLIVDEASMVHLELMTALLDALPARTRLVLLGDKDQLASVEAGAVLADLCAHDAAYDAAHDAAHNTAYDTSTRDWVDELTGCTLPAPGGPALAQQVVALRQSRRFEGAIGQVAQAVNAGNAAATEGALHAPDDTVACLRPRGETDPALDGLATQGRGPHPGYGPYLELLRQGPADKSPAAFDAWGLALLQAFDRFRVLCALREGPWGVSGWNARIEAALAEQGLRVGREAYPGRPVMVTRNDPQLGVFNGDIGLTLKTPDGQLRVVFADCGRLRSVAASRLADAQTAFALTVHKAQGSEFEHVALVLPERDNPVLSRELLYTGITRARKAFTLVAPPGAPLAEAVARRTVRFGGLGERVR